MVHGMYYYSACLTCAVASAPQPRHANTNKDVSPLPPNVPFLTKYCALPFQIVYPKPTDKPLYKGLVTQARALEMPMLSWEDVQVS